MRGGYRQGAGRKKGFAAKNAEEARRILSERVLEEIGPICEVLINKAKEGDIRAVKELFDRAWGRSSQAETFGEFETTQTIPIYSIPREIAEKNEVGIKHEELGSRKS